MKYQNNPFNIRSTSKKWSFEIEPKNGFCQFWTLYYGYRAAMYLIYLSYCRQGVLSLRDIISRWAPSSDGNDTDKYIKYVCGDVFDPGSVFINLNIYSQFQVLSRMAWIETRHDFQWSIFCDVIKSNPNFFSDHL